MVAGEVLASPAFREALAEAVAEALRAEWTTDRGPSPLETWMGDAAAIVARMLTPTPQGSAGSGEEP